MSIEGRSSAASPPLPPRPAATKKNRGMKTWAQMITAKNGVLHDICRRLAQGKALGGLDAEEGGERAEGIHPGLARELEEKMARAVKTSRKRFAWPLQTPSAAASSEGSPSSVAAVVTSSPPRQWPLFLTWLASKGNTRGLKARPKFSFGRESHNLFHIIFFSRQRRDEYFRRGDQGLPLRGSP